MRSSVRIVLTTGLVLAAALAIAACTPSAADADNTAKASAPKTSAQGDKHMEQAAFGAGCFWGVEATFQQVKGVTETAVGYMGGTTENPTYKQVCAGDTGHVETVHVTYDPGVVSYDKLLDVFWKNHDPTQVNRQGPDVGWQYRSVIFTYSPEQKKTAEMAKAALDKAGTFGRPIATVIEPSATFWRAEDYHQKYLEKRGMLKCH